MRSPDGAAAFPPEIRQKRKAAKMLLPRKKVISNIAVRNRQARDGTTATYYEAYLGVSPVTHRKIRFMCGDRAALVRKIEEFYRTERSVGESFVAIRPDEAFDARAALEILREAGVARSLRDVALDYVQRAQEEQGVNEKPLGEAMEEYVASFPEVQDKHRTAIRQRVGGFAARFGADRNCSEVDGKSVVEFLDRHDNPKTWNNEFGYIKSFINWCAAPSRRYVASNPLAEMRAKPIAHKDPPFMAPEDVEKLFRHFEERGDAAVLAYLTLAFFCGIRREEIIRLSMQEEELVSADDESIRVRMPKGWTRGMRPRTVPLGENAAAWIRAYGLGEALRGSSVLYSADQAHDAADAMGIAMPKNVARHTFITMHVAAYHNEQVTQTICGTSKEMLVQSYMGLATRAQGRAYFDIMPKGVDATPKP